MEAESVPEPAPDMSAQERHRLLQSLLAQVEAATGADRVLDFELHIALVEDANWPATDRQGRITNQNSRMSDYLATYRDVIDADDLDFDFARYTASLDAAPALCERVLPGHEKMLSDEFRGDAHVWYAEVGDPLRTGTTEAATPALALLAAMLKALIAKETP